MATYVGPNWSIIDRNVIGNADSVLRAGPNGPTPGVPTSTTGVPYGIGSLGIHTASGADHSSFGNQIDFEGVLVKDLTKIGFSVYTTKENNKLSTNNMPGIKIEIDPNLQRSASGYSTLVYVPDNGVAGSWTHFDATGDPGAHWGLTGSAFPATETCSLYGTLCTWKDILTALEADNPDDAEPAKVSYSVAISKGRDHAFSGAVDGLEINDKVYDFEPFGVHTSTN